MHKGVCGPEAWLITFLVMCDIRCWCCYIPVLTSLFYLVIFWVICFRFIVTWTECHWWLCCESDLFAKFEKLRFHETWSKHETGLQWQWNGWVLLTACEPFSCKMNGHLDRYVPVSMSNGFRDTVQSGLSAANYESLIDLSPSRCRAASNPNSQDVVREGETSRVGYDSPSLPTNGVLYRNSSEAANASHLPGHYWTGELWLFWVIFL